MSKTLPALTPPVPAPISRSEIVALFDFIPAIVAMGMLPDSAVASIAGIKAAVEARLQVGSIVKIDVDETIVFRAEVVK